MRHFLLFFLTSLYVKGFRRTVRFERPFCTSLWSMDSTFLGPRALDMEYTNGIRLVTGVYSFSWSSPDVLSSSTSTRTKAHVDLYSMLHIGDKSYYDEISSRMKAYDVVLYELITDTRNCAQIDGKDYKRKLTKEIYSKVTNHPNSSSSLLPCQPLICSSIPIHHIIESIVSLKDASSLASRFGLVTQVDHLYNAMALTDESKNQSKNHQWFIADLDTAGGLIPSQSCTHLCFCA